MKNFIIKSCLFAAACVMLTACNTTGKDLSPPSSTTVTLKSSSDQTRVHELYSPSFAASSSAYSTMPQFRIASIPTSEAEPSIPTDATSMVGKDLSWGVTANSSYYLPADETYSGQIMFDNSTCYYIAGNLTLSYWNVWGATGGTIYVLEGGSLTVTGEVNYIAVKNWGTINFNGDFEINSEGEFYNYSTQPLTTDNHLSLRGTFYSASEVAAKSILLSGDKEIVFAECVTVDQDFYAENYANVYLDKGLESASITLDSYAKIYLQENSLVKTSSITYNNDSRFINESATGYAVIAIDSYLKIHNNTYYERMSGGEIRLHCDESNIEDDYSGTAIQWAANVSLNASNTYIASEDNCFGGYGENSGDTSEDEVTLEHVTSLDSPDYERISATSIDFKDGYVFVSWHERGDYYQGYIDIMNMTDLIIAATYYTTELDFNHIYVSPNNIYVTGGRSKGAFYSSIDYSLTDSSVDIDIISVEGSSGNCILQEDGDNWIVSGANGGITISNEVDSDIYTDLAEAKFVTKYGNNMAVLAGVSPSDAVIYEYDTDGDFVKQYTVGTIPTTDGKNTLFADGDDIYACLGEGGLKIYNNGSAVKSFENTTGSGSVNCVDVDDNYIYIANGVAGLYILDKESLDVVKTYQLGDTSANYVKLGDNGLIYVAYGLDGVHTFKLKVQ
ncbi:MAG: hypothetical protein R3Y59_06945 [bacterium]